MKILVTGGAGFVGSHLCERLHADGHEVTSLDNYFTGSKENHIEGVTYIEGHTKDIEKHITEVPEMIYHLGEYSRVEQSFADVATVLEFNTQGTQSVAEFCRKNNIRLIYAGSSTKFADGGAGRDQSPYAWSKAVNTELVKNYGVWFELDYAITYFYNVYGPRERGMGSAYGTLTGIFRDLHNAKEKLTVRLPGTQKRNFTHVLDIVDGLVLVGQNGHGDEYGLGHPDAYSILEVAQMFGDEIEMLPNRPGNRLDSVVHTERSVNELGWSPKRNLPDYIKSIT
jgi:UDP-glucose 4-epimerase